jgi:hypothetical protein
MAERRNRRSHALELQGLNGLGFPLTLAAYDAHPDHKAAGARLVALCTGGVAGLMVFDLEVAP